MNDIDVVDTSSRGFTRRHLLQWIAGAAAGSRTARVLEIESNAVEPQPYFAAINRTAESLAELGEPLVQSDLERLATLSVQRDLQAVKEAEAILDRYTLVRVLLYSDG